MRKFYNITQKSFQELGVETTKDLWEKVKGEHSGLCKSVDTEFKKVEDTDNKFDVTMSTATEDRHGDVVQQNWDLKNFKKNPILLDSHNYMSIEHILGKVNKPRVSDGNLVGQIEFMLDNPKGLLAYKMAVGGYLNATSVGFIPTKFDDEGNIEKSELLELSAVSVPANAEALFEKSVKEIGEELDKEETPEDEPEDTESVIEPVVEKVKKQTKLEALKAVTDRQARLREESLKKALIELNELLGEGSGRNSALADRAKRKQIVNRAIRGLLKVK